MITKISKKKKVRIEKIVNLEKGDGGEKEKEKQILPAAFNSTNSMAMSIEVFVTSANESREGERGREGVRENPREGAMRVGARGVFREMEVMRGLVVGEGGLAEGSGELGAVK